jgi:hypothetical protein
MNARSVLEKATAQGVVLFVADGKIRGRGPKPRAAFLSELRQHEAELVALLGGPEPTAKLPVGGFGGRPRGHIFGDCGSELTRLGWQANDLFAVPGNDTRGGLLWFIKGSPVVAIGQTAAFVQDGRLYRRHGQAGVMKVAATLWIYP